MELFDTHAHINFNAFKDDGDDVIRRSFDAGMFLIMPGSQIDTSRRALEYAKRFDDARLWAAVGLHPIHLEEMELDESEEQPLVKFQTRKEKFSWTAYEPLARDRKTVAIGEIGLDYWHQPKSALLKQEFVARQQKTLQEQLDLAIEVHKPVILHCRVAHDDLLEIVKKHPITKEVFPPGVIHCFTGNAHQARAFMEMGFYLGFNGIIFKLDLEEVIRFVPLEKMVLETDSPYLTPPAAGGEKVRNEPLNVRYVAEKIAELKNVPLEEVAKITVENAHEVFHT